MKLTGDWATNYDLFYQVYVDGSGWQDWVRNGETAGTIGENKDVLAYRAYIVPKSKSMDTSAMKGVVYTVYSDESCTTKVGDITLDETGKGELTVPYQNTYYVKETSAPSRLELNPNVLTLKLDNTGEYTLYTTDKVKDIVNSMSTSASISGFTSDDKQSIKTDSAGHQVYSIDDGTTEANKYQKNPPKIQDTIHYEGLETGKKYLVKSYLYDKDTNQQIEWFDGRTLLPTGGSMASEEGTEIENDFIPTSENGDFTVTFDKVNIYDQSLYKERTGNDYPYYRNIVIYEEIIDPTTGNVIISHKDPNDEEQSLYLQIKNPRTDKPLRFPLANTGGQAGLILLVLAILGGIYLSLQKSLRKQDNTKSKK